ncbi:hypothetical protein BH23ACT12_BH23ACT12_11240 [soil metagenome]
MRFEEVQVMPKAWTLVSILPGVALIIGVLAEGASAVRVPLSVVIIAVGATLLFGSWFRSIRLITVVGADTINLRYRGLLKTRTIPIPSVRSAEARTYKPLREYGGWGIKYGPKGWVYNVSGKEGVQLKLENAKPLLIGSGRANELVEAITSSPAYRAGGSGRRPPALSYFDLKN